jgi:Mce-associated membrane protein
MTEDEPLAVEPGLASESAESAEAGELTPRPAPGRHRRTTEPADRSRSRQTTATLVLALLCVPAAAAALIFWLVTPSSAASSSAPGPLLSANTQSALTAAKSSAQAILSYDYRSIGPDIARAKADTTGVFAHQYAGTAARLLSEAKQVKAIVQATVGSAGVVSASPSAVVVLLFVDQASVRQDHGQKSPQTRIDQSRVRATMTKVGGTWLVSDLAAL